MTTPQEERDIQVRQYYDTYGYRCCECGHSDGFEWVGYPTEAEALAAAVTHFHRHHGAQTEEK